MKDKTKKYLKWLVASLIVILLLWLVVLYPNISFSKNERKVEKAAKRYFDINYNLLPTGERTAEVTLKELFHKSFLKDDIYIAYTDKPCSLEDSWVKVRKEDGEYKYYTYLKCGLKNSNVDHKGPEIKLNGAEEMTIERGTKYKEPGVKSVKDNKDGKMSIKNVKINSSKLDTNKIGKYEIEYIAVDKLKNVTTKIRTVNVISTLNSVVKNDTDKSNIYKGANPNNYINFSNILWRIVSTDGNNVKLVTHEDIANVNYDGINDWLNYFYNHLNPTSKKYVVKTKYCDMKLKDELEEPKKCTDYTDNKNLYILSAFDMVNSENEKGSYLYPQSMSWIANKISKDKALVTRNSFYYEHVGKRYIPEDINENYGIRPVITIKGNIKLKSGNGTYDNPYNIGDTTAGKVDDKINERNPGEYVKYSGILWRIVEINKDGTTKVIADETLRNDNGKLLISYDTKSSVNQYNPNEKGNIGYYIKNKATEFIDTSYFVNRNIEVPIYSKDIKYKKEKEIKKYKTKLSAPNMYDMFSAKSYESNNIKSFWFLNSSNEFGTQAALTDIGVPVTEIYSYAKFGIRPVGNFDSNVMIVKGKGTISSPYTLTK